MTDFSKQIAQDLLEIGAIKLNPSQPFTWASGIKSPIYTDNRMTIAYPEIRNHIAQGLSELIHEQFPDATVIAGVATAGIAHAALVADRLKLPLSYVRPKPKDHGTGQQIEGRIAADDKVVLIDDLISTGGSVLQAAKVAQATNAKILGVAAIFTYGLPDSEQNFTAANIPLVTLSNYNQLIEQANLEPEIMQSLQQWRQDPHNWKPISK